MSTAAEPILLLLSHLNSHLAGNTDSVPYPVLIKFCKTLNNLWLLKTLGMAISENQTSRIWLQFENVSIRLMSFGSISESHSSICLLHNVANTVPWQLVCRLSLHSI